MQDPVGPSARRVAPCAHPSFHRRIARGGLQAFALSLLLAVAAVPVRAGPAGPKPPPGSPNILLVLMDDVGVELVHCYEEHPEAAHTPVIDSLASDGLLFRRAWSYPTCSPTRAMLLTGKYGFRTGVGRVIDYKNTTWELPTSEVSIADALAEVGYRTAAIGKWHLGGMQLSGPSHALQFGFEHHIGPVSNIHDTDPTETYYSYHKAVDGVIVKSRTYATTDQVDDALSVISEFGSDPWFVWLAFSAPHAPYHKPPDDLHTYVLPPDLLGNIPVHVRAALEALDTELGRLLDSMDPAVRANTIVMVMGDNGTPAEALLPPKLQGGSKATLFQGGVRVPLIMNGPMIPHGAECDALVSLADIFAPCAELTGADAISATDSTSLVPFILDPSMETQRPWLHAESFGPNGVGVPKLADNRGAFDGRYKLITSFDQAGAPASMVLFDLETDALESQDLFGLGPLGPDEQDAFDFLLSETLRLHTGF